MATAPLTGDVDLISWTWDDADGTIIYRASNPRGRDARITSELMEDFHGDVGGTIRTPFVKDMHNTATGDYISGNGGGVYRILTQSTSEAQSGQVTTGDCLMVNMSNNPILQVRVRIAPAGATFTADERVFIGLVPVHATAEASLDDLDGSCGFKMEGANLNILVEADDATTDTDDQDSLIDYVKSAWTVYTIDCTKLSDIKFYVDGVVQQGAVVSMADLAANTYVQPIVCHQRDAGTEANSVDIDYIKVLSDR